MSAAEHLNRSSHLIPCRRHRHAYMMHTRVLDAQNYMVPQRRKRRFMVLLLRSAVVSEFKWPEARGRCHVSAVLRTECASMRRDASLARLNAAQRRIVARVRRKTNPSHHIIIDLQERRWDNYGVNRCPTITASKAARRSFWSLKLKRRLSVDELGALQGLPPLPPSVSEMSRGRMVGNAIPLKMACVLLDAILNSVNIHVNSSVC